MHYQLEELSVELSQQCACRCIMCSSGASPRAGPNELAPDEIIGLIVQAKELGASILSLSGGDPILRYQDSIEYIRMALALDYQEILFYTTGIVRCEARRSFSRIGADYPHAVDGRNLEYMLACLDQTVFDGRADQRHKLKFVFSLHSHRATVHDYIVGLTGGFGATVRAIERVISNGYEAWVHMVPMLPNWQHVCKLRDFCGGLGVSQMSLLRYVPQTRGRTNRRKLALNHDEFEELQRVMVDEIKGGMYAPPTRLRYGCPIDFRHTVDDVQDVKAKPCHAGTDLILVRPDGSVHPCAAWKTLPDDANVRKQSLKEIWETGHVFQAIRHYRERGWEDLGGPCSMCMYLASCKGGCPAQKLHWLGIHVKDRVSMDDLTWPIADPLCPLSGLGDDVACECDGSCGYE